MTLLYLGAALSIGHSQPVVDKSQRPKLIAQTGHTSLIRCMAFSPDNRLLASGSDDKTLRLWDILSGKELRTFRGHTSLVSAVTFEPNTRVLLSGSYDGKVKTWDLSNGEEIASYGFHDSTINALAVSKDGKTVASVADNGTIKLWLLNEGKMEPIKDFPKLPNRVTGVAFSPTDPILATSTEDGSVILWSLDNAQEIAHWKTDSWTNPVVFSIDGKLCAAANSKAVKVWSVASKTEVASFPGTNFPTNALTFVNRDTQLIAGFGRIQIYDLNTKKELDKPALETAPFESIAISQDGKYVASTADDNRIRLWDFYHNQRVALFDRYVNSIDFVATSPDSNFFASVTQDNHIVLNQDVLPWDNMVEVWDPNTGKTLNKFKICAFKLTSLSISPDGKTLIGGGENGEIRLWNTTTGRLLHKLKAHTQSVNVLAFTADGGRVVSGGEDGLVIIWDPNRGQRLLEPIAVNSSISKMALSGNGAILALAGYADSIVEIWDIAERKRLKPIVAFQARTSNRDPWISSLALDFKGGTLAVGSYADNITIWNVSTGQKLTPSKKETFYPPLAIGFLPANDQLVSSGYDARAQFWQLNADKESRATKGRSLTNQSLSIGKDIGTLRCVGFEEIQRPHEHTVDGTVRLWNSSGPTKMASLEVARETIKGIAYSPSGKEIATAVQMNPVMVWKADSCKKIDQLKGESVTTDCVVFSPNGTYVAVGEPYWISVWHWPKRQKIFSEVVSDGSSSIKSLAFSPDNRLLVSADGKSLILWDPFKKIKLKILEESRNGADYITFGSNGSLLLSLNSYTGTVHLWEVNSWQKFDSISLGKASSQCIAVKPKSDEIAIATDNLLHIIDLRKKGKTKSIPYPYGNITSLAYSSDGKSLVIGSSSGALSLLDVEGSIICNIYAIGDNDWIVVDQDGRFDSNNLEQIQGLQWVFPDDFNTPLSPELFIRDYFEPGLLPRLLGKDKAPLKPIRPLDSLNRSQPQVEILSVQPVANRPLEVDVTVRVSSVTRTFKQNRQDVSMTSGAYDVRLLRNGQLTAHWPLAVDSSIGYGVTAQALAKWRSVSEVPLTQGSATQTFRVILASNPTASVVKFSAYAFNADRIKGNTALYSYRMPKNIPKAKSRAYIITVGVSDNEDIAWKLTFPKENAKKMREVLAHQLQEGNIHQEVITVPLITKTPLGGNLLPEDEEFIQPTKANIRMILDILAGGKPSPEQWEEVPQALRPKLRKATPDDLVVLFFSSHGVDTLDSFFLIPFDIGNEVGVGLSKEQLNKAITSEELALWVQKIDVTQMTLVVDACHSAKAVKGDGFKPAPLGDRGLGQLAYDKGIPILVAAQENQKAKGGGEIASSQLTQALVIEALENRKMLLENALIYAVGRVPQLQQQNDVEIQQPALFDFRVKNSSLNQACLEDDLLLLEED